MIDLIGDDELVLDEEQAVMDDHEDTVNKTVEPLAPRTGLDNCLLQQFEEHISSLKAELADIAQAALLLEDEGLLEEHAMIEQALHGLDLKVKRVLHACKNSPQTPENTTGVKLPKTDVPTFDGNILNWKTFWEQFEVAIHLKTQLTKAEKLAYLRHALKGGTAKQVIEGLAQSTD